MITFGTLTVNNSTISGNTASNGQGGGIYNTGGTLTINSSTISNNVASIGTGGVANQNGTLNLSNTIIANSTGSAGDCNSFGGGITNASYSLIEMGNCFTNGNNNNIVADPLLSPLADNGGPTQTSTALMLGSPAIDAGNSNLTTDQRGSLRPVDVPTTANGPGNFADIGAYEMQITTAAAVTVSGRVLNGKGIGVSGAIVLMTEQSGNIRQVRTNMLGYYRLTDVEIGQTLIFNVYHKNYQFNPQVVSITDTISNLNFTSQ
ncbi:MAG: choice-of-anchor Q domain-containing protein [Pyrinomonadaceae bacterium]